MEQGTDEPTTAPDPRGFGLVTATFVVVSSMVGVGILTTSGYTVLDVGSHRASLILWAIGGGLALCGALTLAEMSAALPRSGGEYVILRTAYGPLAGFVAGWVSFLLGFAAPVAASASASASYFLEPFGGSPLGVNLLATTAIVVCGSIQASGRDRTARFQGLVTGTTLGLLGLFVVAGLATAGFVGLGPTPPQPIGTDRPSLGIAIASLVYVNYAFTGWNGAAYIAGEVRDPGTNLPRAIVAGTVLVLLLYLGLNLVYALAMPAETLRELADPDKDAVKPIAALSARRFWGANVATAWAGGFGVVLLASTSTLILSGARVALVMAEDDLFPRFAAWKSPKDGTPRAALGLIVVVALGLLWSGSFEQLVIFSSVGLAVFSMAAIGAIFVLRRRHDLPSPFRTPGYPLVPLIYLVGNGILVLVVLTDPEKAKVGWLSLLGILAGVPMYWIQRWFRRGDEFRDET